MSSSIHPSPQVGVVRQGQDHRSVARSVVTLRATLRFADRLQLIQGTICDLSVGGAGFICTQEVAATTRCTLHFDLPTGASGATVSFDLPVNVVNCVRVSHAAHTIRVNLRFVGLPAVARMQIETLIRQTVSR